jgi:hypothetical protein
MVASVAMVSVPLFWMPAGSSLCSVALAPPGAAPADEPAGADEDEPPGLAEPPEPALLQAPSVAATATAAASAITGRCITYPSNR